ncbi:MAG: glycosyltransferase family 9 protein, partial [Bacteroidales bacterium]|nr:glycosyltransferase family 9 protein [Bacteroidales bacterium]
TYTKPVLQLSENISEIICWDEISQQSNDEIILFFVKKNIDVAIHVFPDKRIAKILKKVKIKIRIGTSHRTFHWTTCNKKVRFSRKKSDLHEAQLNLKLLNPLKLKTDFSLNDLVPYYGIKTPQLTDEEKQITYFDQTILIDDFIDLAKINLVLHTKTNGSAREWGLENFGRLIELLPPEKFKIFISGTKAEGEMMRDFLDGYQDVVTDVSGVFSLPQFIYFLSKTDGLIAASTGPLHLAAMLGKFVAGIYAPMRPIFPQRWAPLGKNTHYLVKNKLCDKCKHSNDCECIRSITPEAVKTVVDKSLV